MRKKSFKPGDIVKWSRDFLRNTGQMRAPEGSGGMARGKIIAFPSPDFSRPDFAKVQWSDRPEGDVTNVNIGNIVLHTAMEVER